MSPRAFSSLPSVFWSPDVENLVELKTFLEGGRKFWRYCCSLILSKPDNYLSSWRLKSQTTAPTKPHLLYTVTKQYKWACWKKTPLCIFLALRSKEGLYKAFLTQRRIFTVFIFFKILFVRCVNLFLRDVFFPAHISSKHILICCSHTRSQDMEECSHILRSYTWNMVFS